MPKIKIASLEPYFVYFGIFLYVLGFSLISLHRYWQFNAFWYDFGILDEAIWKLSRFQLPYVATLNPPTGKVIWGDHFNPSSIFLAPLYWITDKQEIILVAQSVYVGLSAVFAYLLTRKFIKNIFARLSLIISYLGYIGLQNAIYTDIHNIVYSLLPFMIAIWAFYNKKWSLYWLFLIIFIGFQENLTNVSFGLGLFIILSNIKNWKIGIGTILISVLWAVLTLKIVIPYFNHQLAYTYEPHWPGSIKEYLFQLFNPAMKLRTILITYTSFGFLPLLSIPILPMVLGNLIERFVLNVAATRWMLGFHYNSIFSPILFLGSFDLIIRLQKHKFFNKILIGWSIVTIGIVLYFHRFYLHGPLMLATHPFFYKETQSTKFLYDFERNIPKNGLIMAQNNIASHLSHYDITLLDESFWWVKPNVIAIDYRPDQNANNFYPFTEEQVKLIIDKLVINPDYKNISKIDSQFIFVKNK